MHIAEGARINVLARVIGPPYVSAYVSPSSTPSMSWKRSIGRLKQYLSTDAYSVHTQSGRNKHATAAATDPGQQKDGQGAWNDPLLPSSIALSFTGSLNLDRWHAAVGIDIFQQPLAVVHPGGSFSILVELPSRRRLATRRIWTNHWPRWTVLYDIRAGGTK